LTGEVAKGYLDVLEKLWIPEYYTFHSNAWWRSLWEKTGLCEIVSCYDIEGSKTIWRHWADWSLDNFSKQWGGDGEIDAKLVDADKDDNLALIALVARKKKE